jgi:hypothetical protein
MSNKNDGTAIQQHYLPQNSYLKFFTNESDQLHTYRFLKDKLNFPQSAAYFVSSPAKLAKEGYIYEAPHIPTNALEKTLTTVENAYADVLNTKILKKTELTEADEEKIALFIQALHARVPANRSHVNSFLDELDRKGQQVALAHNSPEAAKQFSSQMAHAKEAAFADAIIASLEVNMWQHADICILDIGEIFRNMFFITSDNPVAVLDYAGMNTIYGIAPLNKTIEVVVPINTHQAVFINNAGLHGYHDVDVNFIREINSRIFRMAKQFLLSPTALDAKFYDSINNRFPQSLLLRYLKIPKGKADYRLEEIKKRDGQKNDT